MERDDTRFLADSVGILDASQHARIAVAGADRLDYLNRRVSQKTVDMQPGDGRRAAILDATGKMVADMEIFAFADRVLLFAPPWKAGALAGEIDKYVFTEDCTVADIAPSTEAFLVAGPRAAEALAACGIDPPANRCGDASGGTLVLRTANGIDGHVLVVDAARADALRLALVEAALSCGGGAAHWDAWHRLRIHAGRPWWGAELDESTIPLEADLFDAVHFDKGCYPGQETIARISNLGHPSRQLVRVRIEGPAPAVPAALVAGDGRPAGTLTSIARSLEGPWHAGLAMVKWGHRAAGTTLAAGESRVVVDPPR